MSLSPRYSLSHTLGPNTAHKIEVYLDYVCPFSAKAWRRLRAEIIPALDSKFPGKVQFIFRHQIQPWHPQSTLVHEAGLAVSVLAPEKFFEFNDVLFEKSPEYYDEALYNETRPQTYQRLAKLANESVGVSVEEFLKLVEVPPLPAGAPQALNKGNALAVDLKYFIKQARQNSIHVSPTFVIDGITEPGLESGTSLDVWYDKIAALRD